MQARSESSVGSGTILLAVGEDLQGCREQQGTSSQEVARAMGTWVRVGKHQEKSASSQKRQARDEVQFGIPSGGVHWVPKERSQPAMPAPRRWAESRKREVERARKATQAKSELRRMMSHPNRRVKVDGQSLAGVYPLVPIESPPAKVRHQTYLAV